ncbi:MAG: T9SS type A sorting domain-containing protein [Bacteroidetes bacterium]|nr:T9SS type A sorting domain-containing protein [Bacteroidota bacterium]
MKNFFSSIVFLLISNLAIGQTEWAPVGAKWWVLVESGWSEQKFINKYECTGTLDTLGHTCKVIHEILFDGLEKDYYSYQIGNKVFNYSELGEEFVLNFDYSIQAGEHYEIVAGQDTSIFYVDSVIFETFEGDDFKVQYGRLVIPSIQSESFNKIYEGVGTYTGPWELYDGASIAEVWYTLVCYQTPDGILYDMNPGLDVDCQELSTPVDFIPENKAGFSISPNPTSDPTILDYALPPGTSAEILVLDSYGRTIRQHSLHSPSGSLVLDDLLPGLYFIMLKSNGQVLHTEKLIRF